MSGVELIKVKSQDDGMRLNRWFLKYYPALSLGHFKNCCGPSRLRLTEKEPKPV